MPANRCGGHHLVARRSEEGPIAERSRVSQAAAPIIHSFRGRDRSRMIEASPTQALVIDNVTKTFPGVRALDSVSIELRAGEIHALLGQNGAGKTTLMHILAGVLRPDSGRILIEGRAVDIRNPSDGQRLGISIVHQELSLFPSRTVAENILVGRLPVSRLGFVDEQALHARAREL